MVPRLCECCRQKKYAWSGTKFTKPGDCLFAEPCISEDCGDTEITHFRRKEEEAKRIDFMTAQKRPIHQSGADFSYRITLGSRFPLWLVRKGIRESSFTQILHWSFHISRHTFFNAPKSAWERGNLAGFAIKIVRKIRPYRRVPCMKRLAPKRYLLPLQVTKLDGKIWYGQFCSAFANSKVFGWTTVGSYWSIRFVPILFEIRSNPL